MDTNGSCKNPSIHNGIMPACIGLQKYLLRDHEDGDQVLHHRWFAGIDHQEAQGAPWLDGCKREEREIVVMLQIPRTHNREFLIVNPVL